jgi:Galactose oxidase, central domain
MFDEIGTRGPNRQPPDRRCRRAVVFLEATMKFFPLGGATAGVVFALASTLAPIGIWTNVQPPTSPPYRAGEGLAFEPLSGLVVAYGGVPNHFADPVFNDTWAFDGSSWTQLFPVVNPGLRLNVYLAQSPSIGRLVLFGGAFPVNVANGTTWEFDTQSVTWTNETPIGPSPSPRQLAQLVYDSWRGRTVLFGGTNGPTTTFYNDTWEWDGTSWANVSPAGQAPSARAWHAMAFDSARGRTVLFGGYNGRQLGDTWEWDGTQWTQVTTLLSPSPRSSGAIAYDSSTQRIVLFAGSYGWPIGLNDTWEYDGTNWTPVSIPGPVPLPQYLHRMIGDPVRGGILVYGAFGNDWSPLNDTWRYHRAAPDETDTTPPHVACSGEPAVLWPPNNKLVPVKVNVEVTDDLSGAAGFSLVAAIASEGDATLDIVGFAVGTADTAGQLRASGNGGGNGRIYELIYEGRDVAGNTATCTATVTVPHDRRR